MTHLERVAWTIRGVWPAMLLLFQATSQVGFGDEIRNRELRVEEKEIKASKERITAFEGDEFGFHCVIPQKAQGRSPKAQGRSPPAPEASFIDRDCVQRCSTNATLCLTRGCWKGEGKPPIKEQENVCKDTINKD